MLLDAAVTKLSRGQLSFYHTVSSTVLSASPFPPPLFFIVGRVQTGLMRLSRKPAALVFLFLKSVNVSPGVPIDYDRRGRKMEDEGIEANSAHTADQSVCRQKVATVHYISV